MAFQKRRHAFNVAYCGNSQQAQVGAGNSLLPEKPSME
jgi:hypothetical protein